jgi:hypothetical protein
MRHQKEAGVFATVFELIDEFTDNPAARVTAREIAEKVRFGPRLTPLERQQERVGALVPSSLLVSLQQT